MTLSLDTAYRSFGGEVEASSTPTICRLPDSRRHQPSAIAHSPSVPNSLPSITYPEPEPLVGISHPDECSPGPWDTGSSHETLFEMLLHVSFFFCWPYRDGVSGPL